VASTGKPWQAPASRGKHRQAVASTGKPWQAPASRGKHRQALRDKIQSTFAFFSLVAVIFSRYKSRVSAEPMSADTADSWLEVRCGRKPVGVLIPLRSANS
jgi:hypothetical protein